MIFLSQIREGHQSHWLSSYGMTQCAISFGVGEGGDLVGVGLYSTIRLYNALIEVHASTISLEHCQKKFKLCKFVL